MQFTRTARLFINNPRKPMVVGTKRKTPPTKVLPRKRPTTVGTPVTVAVRTETERPSAEATTATTTTTTTATTASRADSGKSHV